MNWYLYSTVAVIAMSLAVTGAGAATIGGARGWFT